MGIWCLATRVPILRQRYWTPVTVYGNCAVNVGRSWQDKPLSLRAQVLVYRGEVSTPSAYLRVDGRTQPSSASFATPPTRTTFVCPATKGPLLTLKYVLGIPTPVAPILSTQLVCKMLKTHFTVDYVNCC